MNFEEYNYARQLTYIGLCKFLQKKYGLPPKPYYAVNSLGNLSKSVGINRASQGLLLHHVKENEIETLDSVSVAKALPAEYQAPENLCYCDLLEHFLLHILIVEENLEGNHNLGAPEIVCNIIPELNDVFSGWLSSVEEQKCLQKKVRLDKELYLNLIGRFINKCENNRFVDKDTPYKSLNALTGEWDEKKNKPLYREIKKAAKEYKKKIRK